MYAFLTALALKFMHKFMEKFLNKILFIKSQTLGISFGYHVSIISIQTYEYMLHDNNGYNMKFCI